MRERYTTDELAQLNVLELANGTLLFRVEVEQKEEDNTIIGLKDGTAFQHPFATNDKVEPNPAVKSVAGFVAFSKATDSDADLVINSSHY